MPKDEETEAVIDMFELFTCSEDEYRIGSALSFVNYLILHSEKVNHITNEEHDGLKKTSGSVQYH